MCRWPSGLDAAGGRRDMEQSGCSSPGHIGLRRARSSSGKCRWLTRCPVLCVVRHLSWAPVHFCFYSFGGGGEEPLSHLTIHRCPGVVCIHPVFSESLGRICLLLLRLAVCLQPSNHPKTFMLCQPQGAQLSPEREGSCSSWGCLCGLHSSVLPSSMKVGRDRTGSLSGL